MKLSEEIKIELLETAIKKVSDYNLRLETQIQEMKNCSNCIHYTSPLCFDCSRNALAQVGYDNWQLKRSDNNENN